MKNPQPETWLVAFTLAILLLAGFIIGRLVHQGVSLRSGVNSAADSNSKEPAK